MAFSGLGSNGNGGDAFFANIRHKAHLALERMRFVVRSKSLRGCFFDFNTRDYAIVSYRELLVSRRDRSQPLHGELLQRREQNAQIAASDFNVV